MLHTRSQMQRHTYTYIYTHTHTHTHTRPQAQVHAHTSYTAPEADRYVPAQSVRKWSTVSDANRTNSPTTPFPPLAPANATPPKRRALRTLVKPQLLKQSTAMDVLPRQHRQPHVDTPHDVASPAHAAI